MASYNIFKTDTQAARFLGQGKPLSKTDTRAARFMGFNLTAHPSFINRDEARYARGTLASGHNAYSPQSNPKTPPAMQRITE